MFTTVRVNVLAGAVLTIAVVAQPATSATVTCLNCTSEPSEIIREGKRVIEVAKQIRWLQRQYEQAKATYEALSHPNEALGIAKGMLDEQIESPSSRPDIVPRLSYGTIMREGALRFLDQNRHSETEGDDFAAQEMRRREQATANIQAEAQAGFERAQERIGFLRELRASIEGQEDVTAVAAVEARLSSEALFLQNEANNIARLQLVQATASRVDQQRAEQNDRKEALDWYRRARAAAGFGGE